MPSTSLELGGVGRRVTLPSSRIGYNSDQSQRRINWLQIELGGENPYGEVQSGHLFLQAWIASWPTHPLDDLGTLELGEHPAEYDEHSSSSEIVSLMGTESCIVMLVGLFQKEVDEQAQSLYGYEMWEGGTYELCGILVPEPLPKPRWGYYERLGMILRPSETQEDFDLTRCTLQDVALV